MTEPVQTQSDDLTAIFGNLGTDVVVPPAEPDDGLDDGTGEEIPATTEDQPGTTPEGEQPPFEVGSAAEIPAGDKEVSPPVTPAKEQPHIPPTVAKQLRQARREANERANAAEIRAARAEARAELLEELHQKGVFSGTKPAEETRPVEKSPLEKFAEEFPDESPTTKVLLEQRTWEQNQQQAQARRQEVESRTLTLTQQVAQGIQKAKEQYSRLGEGLGLDDVVGLAKAYKLISQEDLEALTPLGTRAGTMAYNLAVEAIRSAGGLAAAELGRRVAVARSRQASAPSVNGKQPKPTKTTTTPVNGGTPQDDGGFGSPITRFIFSK